MIIDILVILVVILLFVLAFILLRALTFARPIPNVEAAEMIEVDVTAVSEHLAKTIRHATISSRDSAINYQPWLDLHHELEVMYPLVHANLKRETINRYSLLYTWQGSQPDLRPVLLAGHLDVVPVDPATLEAWEFPPFEGQIADGAVWGRGTLDDKNQVISLLEAVEILLKDGYQPQRTIYLGFGHDEEIGGPEGARNIVLHLNENNIQLEAVLDEGGALLERVIPGVKLPVATLGNTEKGYLTLKFKVECEAGHSSTPPQQTAIGILALALARLELTPTPAHLHKAVPLFQNAAIGMPFFTQMALANTWLFKGLMQRKLEANPITNALIRTTTAVTMVSGGIKDNILPHKAEAVVNFRLLPGDSIADICEHVRLAISDQRVHFEALEGGAWEAAPVSPMDSPACLSIQRTIRQTFGLVPITPFTVLGATDARYYSALTGNVYRFAPMYITAEDLKGVHGVNEHITVECLKQMVQFYGQLLRSWGSEEL